MNKTKYLPPSQSPTNEKRALSNKKDKKAQGNNISIRNEESPKTSPKSQKKQKGKQRNELDKSLQAKVSPDATIKKSISVVSNGVSEQPKTPVFLSNQKKGTSNSSVKSLKQKNVTENIGLDLGKVKTPKKQHKNDSPEALRKTDNIEQQIKTPKQKLLNQQPNSSKQSATKIKTKNAQEKATNGKVVEEVTKTPQKKPLINKKDTPGVAETPKISKNFGKAGNTGTPLNSSKHSNSDSVQKSAGKSEKKAKQISSPSPTAPGNEQKKFINQKKNAKQGDERWQVDNLSDSFALKVKSKMNKKKPVKKIGNLKPNKKFEESKKKPGFKNKVPKSQKH